MGKFIDRCRRFFARQFAGTKPTAAQLAFDVAFGIIGPVVCLALDPFVFRAGMMGPPMFDGHLAAAFGCGGLAMCALIAWVFLPIRAARPAIGFLAGLMIGGALLAIVIGVRLLPFSLIGLIIGIGILGFTPFISAFTYARNATRACRASRSATFVVLGAMLGIAGPVAFQSHVNRAVEQALTDLASPIASRSAAGAEVLHRYRGLVSVALELKATAVFASDTAARDEFARRFEAATGRPLFMDFD